MISIDEFSLILEDLAAELPEEFFHELNLGISVVEHVKPHPQSRRGELYIMGEYFRSQIGCGISIYYGSFACAFGSIPKAELIAEMRSTLRHEFRHHMEGRSWERGLEIEDQRQMREYLDEGSR